MKRMRTPLEGFTIVELIIVIIVIAIIAAISIVSYQGVTARATNAKIVSNISNYYDTIELYHGYHEVYPPVPGEVDNAVSMTCLGLGYHDGTCGKVSGTTIDESSTFMDELDGISSNKEIVNFDPGTVASEQFVGAVYGIDEVGPPAPHTGYGRVIEWFLMGKDQDCALRGAYSYNSANGNTACEIFLEAV